MNMCPCYEERTMPGLGSYLGRPRLFNWITILLLTAWVILVAIVAETNPADQAAQPADSQAFIESLTR